LPNEQSRFTLKVLAQLRRRVDFPLALASFFAGYPPEFALDKIRLLKLSRNQIRHVKFLLNNHDRLLEEDPSVGRLRMLLAEPYFWDLYEFQRAIQKARDPSRRALAPLIRLRRRIRQLRDVELRPKPLLNGYDLIRLGAAPGPTLGRLAEEMYIAQLEGALRNAEQAEKWVLKWLQKHRTSAK
jgi:hypothetical protein